LRTTKFCTGDETWCAKIFRLTSCILRVETHRCLWRELLRRLDIALYSRDIGVNCMRRSWSNDASGIDSGALRKRLSSRATHATTLRTTSPNSGTHPSGYISRLSTECISGWNYDLPAGTRRPSNLPEKRQSDVSQLVVLSGNSYFFSRWQSCSFFLVNFEMIF